MNYRTRRVGITTELNATIAYLALKRFMDIIVSILALVVAIPIICITCIVVRLESKGNPIYTQKRVGLGNKEFNIYKIRSMVSDAEAKGAKWADKNDARVTKVGSFIRTTRIDELPQFFNILKGDMTLIGPRPEREIFYKEFEKDLPNFRDRLLIKPGLTGYAQVNGGYDISPKEKLELDLYYINNAKCTLDIKIILKTMAIVITGKGAR